MARFNACRRRLAFIGGDLQISSSRLDDGLAELSEPVYDRLVY